MSMPTPSTPAGGTALDARTRALKARLDESLDMNAGAEQQAQGALRQSVAARGGSLYDPGFASREQQITENRQQANVRSQRDYGALQDQAVAEDAQRREAWDREDRIRREAWDREDRQRNEDRNMLTGMTGGRMPSRVNGSGTYGVNAATGQFVMPSQPDLATMQWNQKLANDPNSGYRYGQSTSGSYQSMGMGLDQYGNIAWNGGGLVNYGADANHASSRQGGGSFLQPVSEANTRLNAYNNAVAQQKDAASDIGFLESSTAYDKYMTQDQRVARDAAIMAAVKRMYRF